MVWKAFLQQYYVDQLSTLGSKQSIVIGYNDVVRYNLLLAEELLINPGKVLKDAEDSVPLVTTHRGKPIKAIVRVAHLAKKLLIRDLRSNHINTMVSIDCTVKKVTNVRPRLVVAAFKCARCGNIFYLPQPGDGKFLEPSYCGCNEDKKGVFRLLFKESTSEDHQKVRVQESMAGLRGGEQPQSLDIHLSNDLGGVLAPGQHVIINGILQSIQHITKDGKSADFDIYLDVNSLELDADTFEKLSVTEEEEKQITKIASADPYKSFVKSIAPTIIGHEKEKLAIALQMVGGVTKNMPDGTHIRGDINVLWVGDSGISKTQILRFVSKNHPRAMYVNAKSSTAAGLTGAAVKDNFGEQSWSIEAGTLVLADTGIACVDELDKTTPEVQGSLLEAMEQQTVSKAAAGITTTMMARTSVLAAANPKDGKVDQFKTFIEQVNIILALWQRFDLTFMTRDTPDAERDREIATHVLDWHYKGELHMAGKLSKSDLKAIQPDIDPVLLRKYVAFVRGRIPIMEDNVRKFLEDSYVNYRVMPGSSASVRMLESLIRYSEASAKLRLSNKVELEDARRAIDLMEYSLRQTCFDPATGKIDPEILNVGESSSMKERRAQLKNILVDLKKTNKDGISLDILKHEVEGKQAGKYLEGDLKRMKEIGEIWYTPEGLVLPSK